MSPTDPLEQSNSGGVVSVAAERGPLALEACLLYTSRCV